MMIRLYPQNLKLIWKYYRIFIADSLCIANMQMEESVKDKWHEVIYNFMKWNSGSFLNSKFEKFFF